MKTRNKTKSVLSALLAAVFLLGSVPQVTFAAPGGERMLCAASIHSGEREV